jgi:hypothetical protein
MIDWNNKPEGAQRHGNNVWLKQQNDTVHFYHSERWTKYVDQTLGLKHWIHATTDPRVAPTPAPIQLSWKDAKPEATHILQHQVSSNQVFAIRRYDGEFESTVRRNLFYSSQYWFVVSERPVEDVTVDSTINERGERYGKFNEGADIMQTLKNVMRETDGWKRLTSSQCEALEMIQHKIGRVLNGDPTYDDNWRDICGYSQLILDELNGTKR